MKTYLLLFLFICSYCLGFSQNQASDFAENKSEQYRNPRNNRMNFVPNEVLIKFKDAVAVAAGVRMKVAGVNSVDKVLQAHGITSLEKLFPTEQKPQKTRMMKSPRGTNISIPRIDNIYKVSIPADSITTVLTTNIFQVIEELKALPEVEYAEPNYIRYLDNTESTSLILTNEDLKKSTKSQNNNALYTPNDPLYSQQTNLKSINVDSVWQKTQGDTTQIIAILDTGVDWNHPDLKNNIWTNLNPATSWNIEGVLNDIRGWDFVNNDNNPMDDNGHGTHVAGIAAAEGNNGIGIIGVCPKAKIMPIKVMSNKGTGDVATIVQGINYAATHGATVINMSIGGYFYSQTEETALLNAYPNAFLVAAAGNDQHSIYDINPATGNPYIFYPAAFSFVFGVQADEGYTNFDPDGPIYSESTTGVNYELTAPGCALSTMPNGNYKVLHGTSMATPSVAGAVALYRSYYPTKSLEELWSDFIHSSSGVIDLNKVFFNTKKTPQLDLVSFTMDDQNTGNDKDNKADAGETVNLTLKIRNTGSPASKAYVKIKTANDGNPDDITIVKDSVSFGSIGIYRTMVNDTIPFKVKLSETCNNNSSASLDVWMYNNVDSTIVKQNIKFKIYNGQELSGILLRDTLLTADKNWVITNSLRISTGITVTIQPGTSIEILAGVDNRGKVIAIGTPEKRINMKGIIGGDVTYKYANIDAKGGSLGGMYDYNRNIEYCDLSNFVGLGALKMKNLRVQNSQLSNFNCDSVYRCSFLNSSFPAGIRASSWGLNGVVSESSFDNFWFQSNATISISKFNIFKNLYDYNYKTHPTFPISYFKNTFFFIRYNGISNTIIKNVFLDNGKYSYFFSTNGSEDIISLPNQYWGTTDSKKIKPKYFDFTDDAGTPFLNLEPKLTVPSDSCPGFVWKVLVNGKDAQDEVVEPVGVGKHRFDVYFNRAMNKDSIPQVTFGGIYPYTSNKINENGSWSADGKIYTIYKTIKLTTGDGINQIRVAGAKQAGDWGWTIPVEDSRFSFTISAANSASTEFMATAGLGKVKLEWNNNDLQDGLGYNMYRMEHINDSTLTTPVMINSSLITDTLYTDYSIIPNKKYYYYYKVMRTNLTETDQSKVVSSTPFTASKGDANGDLSVNVLDVTSIVAYLLNQNPQPFIFEAADMNSDNSVNVLDIVGVVSKVLNGAQKVRGMEQDKLVDLVLENDTLFANSNTAIGGIQLDIKGVSSIEDIQVLKALNGFESGNSVISDSLRLIFYSMSGKNIPSGERIPLLKLKNGSTILNAIFGGTNGSPIKVNYIMTRIGDIQNNMNQTVAELGQNFPNPVNGRTIIPIRIYEPVDEAVLRVINMVGQEVMITRLTNPNIGEHLLPWNSGAKKGLFVYTLEIKNANQKQICPVKKMIVQ